MPPKHVLIAGGGLAGPALAVALARRNICSTIFEIRSVKGDSGGSITLAPNALKVLDKSVGVYPAIKAAGYAYYRFAAYLEDGYRLGEACVGEEEEGGYPSVRILRPSIHSALLDACEKYRDQIEIRWGAKVHKIEEAKDGVTAMFEDGSTSTGDILIGADGIHSKVREYVLGAAAPTPIFSGTYTVNGFIDRDRINTPPGFSFPATVFSASGLLMTIPIDPEGKRLTFGISQAVEEKDREGWKEYERSGQALRDGKKLYEGVTTEPIRSLLDNINEKEGRLWAPYGIPDLPTWHKGRVLLIGDAAHALPPNGQGSAQAFEDAAVLVRLLASDTADDMDYEALFGRFETVRRPRIEEVKKANKMAGSVKGRTGPWAWYAKTWLFWAYFAWNRGVVKFSGITSYDATVAELP